MSLIITLNKSQLLFKMRVAVQGLRMERNRRLLWDMTKIIFNSFMTILIFVLLIGMGKLTNGNGREIYNNLETLYALPK